MRVFENKALRRIFEPRRDEVTGEWKRLHNELCHLLSSPNIIRVIKRTLKLAGDVARLWAEEVYAGVLWGNLKEIDHLEDLGLDG